MRIVIVHPENAADHNRRPDVRACLGPDFVAADYEMLGIISASHIARWLNHIGLME